MDEDMMAVLLDPPPPAGIAVFASEGELREVLGDSPPQQQARPPAARPIPARPHAATCKPQQQHTLSLLRRVRVDASAIQPNRLNQQFSRVFHEMHAAIAFKVRSRPDLRARRYELRARRYDLGPRAPPSALRRCAASTTRPSSSGSVHVSRSPRTTSLS